MYLRELAGANMCTHRGSWRPSQETGQPDLADDSKRARLMSGIFAEIDVKKDAERGEHRGRLKARLETVY